jgi:hypothetical protein
MLGFVLVYVPWVAYFYLQQADPMIAMGIRTGADVIESVLFAPTTTPINRMAFWLAVCTAYLILAIAPFLPLLFASLGAQHLWLAEERYMFIAFGTLALAFAVTAIYFMWRTQPTPRYIEGRYLTYLIALIPIIALVAVKRLRSIDALRLRLFLWIGLIVALGVIYAAYRLLISHSPLELTPQFTGNTWVALDVIAFQAKPIPIFGSMIRLLFALFILQAIGITLLHRYAQVLALTTWFVFSAVAGGMLAHQVSSHQELARHGKALAVIYSDYIEQSHSLLPVPIIVDASTYVTRGFAYYSIEFWGAQNPRIDFRLQTDPQLQLPEFGAQLTTVSRPDPRLSYHVWNQEYYVYNLDVPTDNPSALSIIDYGPKQASVGQLFNQQPNGMSAFWFKTQNAKPGIVLVLGDLEFQVDYDSPELVTVAISPSQLRAPGTLSLYLFDPQTGAKSNTVTFTLRKND